MKAKLHDNGSFRALDKISDKYGHVSARKWQIVQPFRLIIRAKKLFHSAETGSFVHQIREHERKLEQFTWAMVVFPMVD